MRMYLCDVMVSWLHGTSFEYCWPIWELKAVFRTQMDIHWWLAICDNQFFFSVMIKCLIIQITERYSKRKTAVFSHFIHYEWGRLNGWERGKQDSETVVPQTKAYNFKEYLFVKKYFPAASICRYLWSRSCFPLLNKCEDFAAHGLREKETWKRI